jgi:hypothetical protein
LASWRLIWRPCWAFLARLWKVDRCSSSGYNWPVANNRYWVRSR